MLLLSSCAKKTIPNESTIWLVEPKTVTHVTIMDSIIIRREMIITNRVTITNEMVLHDIINDWTTHFYITKDSGVVIHTIDDLNGDMVWTGLFIANTPFNQLTGHNYIIHPLDNHATFHCLTTEGKMFASYYPYEDRFSRYVIDGAAYMYYQEELYKDEFPQW